MNKKKRTIKSYKLKTSYIDYLLKVAFKRFIRKKNNEYSTNRKHRMAVYANDYIGSEIFIEGVYEKDCIGEIIEICSLVGIDMKNSNAIDIGANIGNHALEFSKFFGNVDAFEPNPHTFKLLQFNASFVKNIRTYNFGLGNSNKTLILSENSSNYGASSALINHNEGLDILIKVKKLDNYIDDLSNIKLIKIDVEGMELMVLQGALKIIDKNQPIIAFEQHESDFIANDNDTPSIKLLRKLGYNFCYSQTSDDKKKSWLVNRLNNILELFIGKTTNRKIILEKTIPRRYHSLIVAIPPKYEKEISLLANN
jgi:FkbM family methyltransferase